VRTKRNQAVTGAEVVELSGFSGFSDPNYPVMEPCTAVEAVSLILTEKPATVGDAFRLVFLFPSFPPPLPSSPPSTPKPKGENDDNDDV